MTKTEPAYLVKLTSEGEVTVRFTDTGETHGFLDLNEWDEFWCDEAIKPRPVILDESVRNWHTAECGGPEVMMICDHMCNEYPA